MKQGHIHLYKAALRVNESFRALKKILEIAFGGWFYHSYWGGMKKMP